MMGMQDGAIPTPSFSRWVETVMRTNGISNKALARAYQHLVPKNERGETAKRRRRGSPEAPVALDMKLIAQVKSGTAPSRQYGSEIVYRFGQALGSFPSANASGPEALRVCGRQAELFALCGSIVNIEGEATWEQASIAYEVFADILGTNATGYSLHDGLINPQKSRPVFDAAWSRWTANPDSAVLTRRFHAASVLLQDNPSSLDLAAAKSVVAEWRFDFVRPTVVLETFGNNLAREIFISRATGKPLDEQRLREQFSSPIELISASVPRNDRRPSHQRRIATSPTLKAP